MNCPVQRLTWKLKAADTFDLASAMMSLVALPVALVAAGDAALVVGVATIDLPASLAAAVEN